VTGEKEIFRTESLPSEELLVYGKPDLPEIARVYNCQLPRFPEGPHAKAMEGVLKGVDGVVVPWSQAMPPKAFKSSIERLAHELWHGFSDLNLDYYRNYYSKTLPLLEMMQPAKINPMAWMLHKRSPDLVTPHVFAGFEANSLGYARKIHYSKSLTKTGRLKVVEGPNILLLPKVQRNIIASRFGINGKLVQLDFRALEPRVVFSLSSPLPGSVPLIRKLGDDIYQEVLTNLGITDVKREQVKEVILGQLYGLSHEKIIEKLPDIKDKEGFVEAVNDFFGLSLIRQQLLEEYEANDRKFISSFYGRPLDTTDAKPYMLLNYFAQSTAVDVALFGFMNIVEFIKNNELIVPVFIIHDALVLDVHNSAMHLLPELQKIGSTNIPKLNSVVFPISSSRF